MNTLHLEKEHKVPRSDSLQRQVATLLFQSTIDAESADLISSSQMNTREDEINKLLSQLREANR